MRLSSPPGPRFHHALLALLLAACGDSGSGSASDAGGDSEASTGAPTSTGEATDSGSSDATTAGTSGSEGSDSDASSDATEPGTTDPGTTDPSTTTGTTDPGTTTGTTDPGTTGTSDTGVMPDMGGNDCPPDGQDATFDYIWIANTGEGTVSKIRTADGVTEGKYRTGPVASSPSRTSVNQYGDVVVSNRDPGGATKISAVLSRCVDENGNGDIDTSTGLGDIRPWGQDECVLWHTPFPLANGYSGGARATAWEGVAQDPQTCETPTPRVWIGWKDAANTAHFVRLHGDTGEILDDVLVPNWSSNGFGPYGGAVNAQGDFLANGYDNEISVRIDAETLEVVNLGLSPAGWKYGMGVDANGNMWVGSFSGQHNLYYYDVQAQQWQGLGSGGGSILGVAVDKEGRVWGAGTGPCRLAEADVETKTFTNTNIALPGCGSPWGVSVDNEGYVWVVDKANKAYKVDPDTYAVELIVTDLISPYTYSDMTGQGLQLVIIE